MIVYDSKRQPYQLGSEIGRGGEATIYEVTRQPHWLAKIYTGAPRDGYDQKLAWMLAHPPNDPTQAQGHASIAWPLGLLYGEQRNFIGYLMPYIRHAVPLLEVFNPRRRLKTWPNFTPRYLYRTARNLAATLGAIHAQGYVVGDINESNILVTAEAMVTFIDTDSFQAQEQDGARLLVYPCPVGKPEYTSPELQGRSFQQTIQQPEQDNFGLGVLIFQLLMDGSHPFRAQWLQKSDPPPVEERIRQGYFPHTPKLSTYVAPPRHVPPLSTLHPELVKLIQQCFIEGQDKPRQRPQAEAWVSALSEAERVLLQCVKGHFYSHHLATCPQCEAPTKPHKTTSARAVTSKALAMPIAVPPTPAPTLPLAKLAISAITKPHPVASTLCPKCGRVNLSAEIYCQNCTQQLCGNRACPYCTTAIPTKARYCTHCGSKVG